MVDPLRNIEIKTLERMSSEERAAYRKQRKSALAIYRQAIDATMKVAALPYYHGCRHMRAPLSPEEQAYHEAVTRRLSNTR